MLRWAVLECDGPVAVRYPKGGEGAFRGDGGAAGTCVLRPGRDITLLGYGGMIDQLLDCAQRLEADGIDPEIIKLNAITPLDMEPILASVKKTGRLLCAEEAARSNSVGRRVAAALLEAGVSLRGLALADLGDGVVPQGAVDKLRQLRGLDGAHLHQKAQEVCGHGG